MALEFVLRWAIKQTSNEQERSERKIGINCFHAKNWSQWERMIRRMMCLSIIVYIVCTKPDSISLRGNEHRTIKFQWKYSILFEKILQKYNRIFCSDFASFNWFCLLSRQIHLNRNFMQPKNIARNRNKHDFSFLIFLHRNDGDKYFFFILVYISSSYDGIANAYVRRMWERIIAEKKC